MDGWGGMLFSGAASLDGDESIAMLRNGPRRRPTLQLTLLCVGCLVVTSGCGPATAPLPMGVDPHIELLSMRDGIPRCPAPIAQKWSFSYFRLEDDELDTVGGSLPPPSDATERSRSVIEEHPAIGYGVYEKFQYPRFLEMVTPKDDIYKSAATSDPGGEAIDALVKGKSPPGWLSGMGRPQRILRETIGRWAPRQGTLLDEAAPEGSELQLVLLTRHTGAAFYLPTTTDVYAIATLITPGQRPLQAGRHYVDEELFGNPAQALLYGNGLRIPSLQQAYAEAPGSPKGYVLLENIVAAVLGIDAMFELCIAQHVRTGRLSEEDYPPPRAKARR